jgi:hypothetical protein
MRQKKFVYASQPVALKADLPDRAGFDLPPVVCQALGIADRLTLRRGHDRSQFRKQGLEFATIEGSIVNCRTLTHDFRSLVRIRYARKAIEFG